METCESFDSTNGTLDIEEEVNRNPRNALLKNYGISSNK